MSGCQPLAQMVDRRSERRTDKEWSGRSSLALKCAACFDQRPSLCTAGLCREDGGEGGCQRLESSDMAKHCGKTFGRYLARIGAASDAPTGQLRHVTRLSKRIDQIFELGEQPLNVRWQELGITDTVERMGEPGPGLLGQLR